MFTSAVVRQLDAEGKRKLSDGIGDHLDDVPRDKRHVTIRHLLSHTSGALAKHPEPLAKMDRDAFIEWFLATPLERKPGEPWGLGWRLSRTTRKTPLHYHDGSLPGFNALFARYTEENAVIIILCNRDEAAGKVGTRISRDFFQD